MHSRLSESRCQDVQVHRHALIARSLPSEVLANSWLCWICNLLVNSWEIAIIYMLHIYAIAIYLQLIRSFGLPPLLS